MGVLMSEQSKYVPTDPDGKLAWHIERATKAFSYGHLQDLVTLLRKLTRERVTIAQFLWYMERKRQERAGVIERSIKLRARVKKERAAFMRQAPKCPSCEIPLRLSTGDENDSHWTCPKCRYGRYDSRPAGVIMDEIRKNAGLVDA